MRDDPIVPGNYRHKLYPVRRNKYGKLVSDHGVTIEEEVASIRARHAAIREYNRKRNAARRARIKATKNAANHSALDKSDAR